MRMNDPTPGRSPTPGKGRGRRLAHAPCSAGAIALHRTSVLGSSCFCPAKVIFRSGGVARLDSLAGEILCLSIADWIVPDPFYGQENRPLL